MVLSLHVLNFFLKFLDLLRPIVVITANFVIDRRVRYCTFTLIISNELLQLGPLLREHLMLNTECGPFSLGACSTRASRRPAFTTTICLLQLFQKLPILLLEQSDTFHVLVLHGGYL